MTTRDLRALAMLAAIFGLTMLMGLCLGGCRSTRGEDYERGFDDGIRFMQTMNCKDQFSMRNP